MSKVGEVATCTTDGEVTNFAGGGTGNGGQCFLQHEREWFDGYRVVTVIKDLRDMRQ